MSSGALRAAWESAQKPQAASKPGDALRQAWEAAQPKRPSLAPNESTAMTGKRMDPSDYDPVGFAKGVARSAGQGVFGLGDEIHAALGEFPLRVAHALGVGTNVPARDYGTALQQEQQGLQDFRGQHPVAAFASEIGGSLASGGAFGAAAEGAGLGAKTVQGMGALKRAGVAAGSGALAGAGAAEGDVLDRAKGAGMGALFGLGANAAMGAGGAAVNAVRGIGKGRTALQVAEERANAMLLQKLAKSGTTLDDLTTRSATARPGETVMEFAGSTGNPVQRLARGVHTAGGEGGERLRQALVTRGEGQRGRVIADIDEAFGRQQGDVFQTADDLAARQRANARPAYDKAYAGPDLDDAELDRMFYDEPRFAEMYERGRPVARTVDGVDVPPLRRAGELPELTLRDANGNLRRNLRDVPDEDLAAEAQRLAELNASEEGAHAGIQEAGYREHYDALPRTEKLGHKGREDLPDADGMMDPDVLDQHNKTMREYNRRQVVRESRARSITRLDDEMARRSSDPSHALGEAFDDDSFSFGANAPPSLTRTVFPVRGLDAMKKGLDAMIESRSASGSALSRAEAAGLRGRLRSLLDRVDELAPDYKAARSQWAGDERAEEALQAGRNYRKQDPREIARTTAGFRSAGEREQHLAGAHDAARVAVDDVRDNRNLRDVVAGDERERQRLRAVLGNDRANDLSGRLNRESDMRGTSAFVMGGSNSINKAADIADGANIPVGPLLQAAAGKPQGAITAVISSVVRRLQGLNPAVADAIAKKITAGTASASDLTDAIAALRAAEQQALQRRTGQAGRALATGNLAGQAGGSRIRP